MQHRGNRAAAEAAKEEMAAREEMENLQRVFSFLLDNGPDKKVGSGNVTKDQLYKTLKRLQYPNLTMKVVEDMIWEVDENCDGMLGWEEFKEMFFRVRQDKIGWEPRRLFNCVEVRSQLLSAGPLSSGPTRWHQHRLRAFGVPRTS